MFEGLIKRIKSFIHSQRVLTAYARNTPPPNLQPYSSVTGGITSAAHTARPAQKTQLFLGHWSIVSLGCCRKTQLLIKPHWWKSQHSVCFNTRLYDNTQPPSKTWRKAGISPAQFNRQSHWERLQNSMLSFSHFSSFVCYNLYACPKLKKKKAVNHTRVPLISPSFQFCYGNFHKLSGLTILLFAIPSFYLFSTRKEAAWLWNYVHVSIVTVSQVL